MTGSLPSPAPDEPGQHAVLALGSNLGDRLATLQGGVALPCWPSAR